MNFITDLLDAPLILVFVILFLGAGLGQIKIKGLGLGSAGVLLIAIVFGHFGYQISPIIQELGLSLFMVVIGLQAGPRVVRMMRVKGIIYGIITLFIVFIAAISTFIVSKLLQLSALLSVGIMTGAPTSTPGHTADIQATKDPIASAAYGIAYPFA